MNKEEYNTSQTTQFWRVYYDSRDKHGKVWWSVDNGNLLSEIKVGWVRILPGAAVISFTSEKPQENAGGPRGWFGIAAIADFYNGGVEFRV
jgi:hypothetical protein